MSTATVAGPLGAASRDGALRERLKRRRRPLDICCPAPMVLLAGPSATPSARRTLGAEVLGPRRPGRRSPGPSLAQAPKTRALIGPGAEVLGPCWPERRGPGPSLTRAPKTWALAGPGAEGLSACSILPFTVLRSVHLTF